MFSLDALRAAPFDDFYPERREPQADDLVDRIGSAVTGRALRRLRASPFRVNAILPRVAEAAARYEGLAPQALREQAIELKLALRREGITDALAGRAFALVREAAGATLGMRHFEVQLKGGWILLCGMVAEMETGEGKTLTATLPACTAALAGVPVHVITVNDYLVERDCELMRPVYESLGLTVAFVTAEMEHAERQAAYRCDVVYCSNKTVVFDYLRDRILLGAGSSPLHLTLERLYGADARSRRLLLRGLSFAIVDEADSVLIDEARTPLIISKEVAPGAEAQVAGQALEVAGQLRIGEDFVIFKQDRRVALTQPGHARVVALCRALGGIWSGAMRRDELVTQALSALHLFVRDDHYLVRDGKIQVIDEHTGRVMADRSWGQGLHQLIEAKEGLEITAHRETIARISYQRFFRRYLHLSGMTGTGQEVKGELGSVYGLPVVRVPTHRPSRRMHLPDRIFATEAGKWQAVVDRIAEIRAVGAPVLVGTRSVADSETLGALLAKRGVEHTVLNAKQDAEEAEIVARAGEPGRITIATNMAGRGTDIKLSARAAELGGLHVIICERHEAGRIDRQLAGRSARQGDPGHVEAILSLEDALLKPYRGGPTEWLVRRLGGQWRRRWIRYAQLRTERYHSRIRRQLLKIDRQTGDVLAFSGKPE